MLGPIPWLAVDLDALYLCVCCLHSAFVALAIVESVTSIVWLFIACLYFDHCYPPDAGYGYVAVSRFRSRAGCYLYGRIRQTDFIPVGAASESVRSIRGRISESDPEDEGEDSQSEAHSDAFSYGARLRDEYSGSEDGDVGSDLEHDVWASDGAEPTHSGSAALLSLMAG